jgi:hypothetical protein
LLLYRRDLPWQQWAPLALFSAGLPLVVVITTIGVEEGRMRPVNAAALVGAGIVVCALLSDDRADLVPTEGQINTDIDD